MTAHRFILQKQKKHSPIILYKISFGNVHLLNKAEAYFLLFGIEQVLSIYILFPVFARIGNYCINPVTTVLNASVHKCQRRDDAPSDGSPPDMISAKLVNAGAVS